MQRPYQKHSEKAYLAIVKAVATCLLEALQVRCLFFCFLDLCSLVEGAVSRTVVSPLERVKILSQVRSATIFSLFLKTILRSKVCIIHPTNKEGFIAPYATSGVKMGCSVIFWEMEPM